MSSVIAPRPVSAKPPQVSSQNRPMNESYLTKLFPNQTSTPSLPEKNHVGFLFAEPRLALSEAREQAFEHLRDRIVNHSKTSPQQLVNFHNYLSFLVVLMRPGFDAKDQSALSRPQIESHLQSLFQTDDKGKGLALSQDEIASVCESVLLVCTHSNAWSASSTADTLPLEVLKQHIQLRPTKQKGPVVAKSFFEKLKQCILSFFRDPPTAGLLSNKQIKSLLDICHSNRITLSPAFLPHARFLSESGCSGHIAIRDEKIKLYLAVLAGNKIPADKALFLLKDLLSGCTYTLDGTQVSLKSAPNTEGYRKAKFYEAIVRSLWTQEKWGTSRALSNPRTAELFTLLCSAGVYLRIPLKVGETDDGKEARFKHVVDKNKEHLTAAFLNLKASAHGRDFSKLLKNFAEVVKR